MSLVPLYKHKNLSRRSGAGLSDFDRIFDNFFHNAISSMTAPHTSASGLTVSLDVKETETSYRITAELPGIEEKDIELTLEDGVLTLSGEKTEEHDESNETLHKIERRYGQFKRVLQLPSDADDRTVDAKLKNGVLFIEIAKLKEAKKDIKRINIKSVK